MANCTGANAQYASLADCKKAAGYLPVGTGADQAGDTLGCRTYHAGAAAQNATVHCPHAGPFGGSGAAGNLVCGPAGANGNCQAFCEIAIKACPAAFADANACATACKAYPVDATLPFGVPDSADNKNNFNCRSYHLTAALSTPQPHCTHIGVTSPVCNQ
jgi:hypothetical protein